MLGLGLVSQSVTMAHVGRHVAFAMATNFGILHVSCPMVDESEPWSVSDLILQLFHDDN